APPAYTITDLGTLGGLQSVANALNDDGVAVGQAENSSRSWRAARFANGTATELPLSGNGVNNVGDIVGEARFGGLFAHAALLTAAGLRDIDTRPGTTTAS